MPLFDTMRDIEEHQQRVACGIAAGPGESEVPLSSNRQPKEH